MMCCSSFFLFAVFAGKARFEKKLARVVRHFLKFRVLCFYVQIYVIPTANYGAKQRMNTVTCRAKE